jgi:hypothetical protein
MVSMNRLTTEMRWALAAQLAEHQPPARRPAWDPRHVSRLQARSEIYLFTLRSHVEGLGSHLGMHQLKSRVDIEH